jgi:hypothetical protein
MYVINASGQPLKFSYGDAEKTLQANEILDVAIFDIGKLNQISKLIASGSLMIYDEENETLTYEDEYNFQYTLKKVIEKEPSIFDNINIDID